MNLEFTDQNNIAVQEGDVCRFFWNPILEEDSGIYEWELPIVYLPEYAAYGFNIKGKNGNDCNVSLFAISMFTEFGFEKI